VQRKGPQAVDLEGLIVEEVLAGIAHAGEMTWRRLVKDHVLNLSKADVLTSDAYLTRLVHAGLVEVTRNKRGTDIVTLTEKGFRLKRGG